MDNIIKIKENGKNSKGPRDYVRSGSTEENLNTKDKYETTGESEFTRDASQPLDEVLSERHYILSNVQTFFREKFRQEKRDYSGVPPKGYARSDARILEDVQEALMKSRRVNPSDISVSVESGIVTLEGVVPTRLMKKASETVCEKVSGVKDVHNKITIEAFGKPLVANRTGLN